MNHPALQLGFLATPLPRVLGAKAKRLAPLGLETVADLLYNFPRRYEDPAKPSDLSRLHVGEQVTVMAAVVQATLRQGRGYNQIILTVEVTDGQRQLELTHFFKKAWQPDWHLKQYQPGRMGLFSGQVNLYRGRPQLVHPKVVWVAGAGDFEDQDEAWIEAGRPAPVYAATAQVDSRQLQLSVRTLLGLIGAQELPDPLPNWLREEHRLPGLTNAFRLIHQPMSDAEWLAGRQRFRFEEAFVLQVALAKRRHLLADVATSAWPLVAGGLVDRLAAQLPFELTNDQRQVGDQISQLLAAPHPMNQLLQGDVGSGKTVVALKAMLQVAQSGGQAALLAPTEVLAAQHFKTVQLLLGEMADQGSGGVAVRLLTGSVAAKAKDAVRAQIEDGSAQIVIGTHALLQGSVSFANLGLVVVDEQHRFGVEQRDQLRQRPGQPPHLLVMTATPIPRTIAMTVFGDLGVLTLRTSPPGRQPVQTVWVNPVTHPGWLDRVWQRVAEEAHAGNRVFVVVPAIEPGQVEAGSDILDQPQAEPLLFGEPVGGTTGRKALTSVTETLSALQANPVLEGLRFQPMHSRLPSATKEQVMAAFRQGEIDVLVCTTVIEVGIDVPDATLLVVLDADRFGLSQLHQLRGRVGRGAKASLCLLVSSAEPDSIAHQRLDAMAKHADGFTLAEVDLRTRHQGDILGAAQSGHRGALRLVDVTKDAKLIGLSRQAGEQVVAKDPDLATNPALAWAVDRLVGEREDFLERG
ncbi:MAG: ATP-dependent DNA helicase RecG [Micrococcales bacterium]|nr:ATP-dependent DNA helicase RecG [Micrococcales bacterium]